MKPADRSQRRTYLDWMLEQQSVDEDFPNKNFCKNLTHSHVNKQNCGIFGSKKPPTIQYERMWLSFERNFPNA